MRRPIRPLFFVLVGGLLVSTFVAIAVGAVSIPPGSALAVLLRPLGIELPWSATEQQAAVLSVIRLPRVCLGLIVGAALGVSGALLQGLFRNPLADPGLVGVSSGAALGAATMIVLGSTVAAWIPAFAGKFLVAVGAFAFGLAATLIVYRIATRGSWTSVTTMLLAGIAVNALCGAGIGALVLFADDQQLRDITFWSLGGLGGATWGVVAVSAPLLGIVLAFVPRLAGDLNAMLLGESEARYLGVRTQRVKKLVVGLSSLAVAAATAFAGLIGFVGLVAPHVVRLVVGPDHRVLLPASALCGAVMLVSADIVARLVMAPAEIPIGIVAAITGAPVFLWLLLRQSAPNLATA